MHHAIHAFGLAEILKRGGIVDVDDEHFWKFIDNTYIDDVSNLLLSVRSQLLTHLGQRNYADWS